MSWEVIWRGAKAGLSLFGFGLLLMAFFAVIGGVIFTIGIWLFGNPVVAVITSSIMMLAVIFTMAGILDEINKEDK